MDNISFFQDETALSVGIPYEDINWEDVEGQPFGRASQFGVIVFGDANNIIDVDGAMAIGGSFNSPRGLSVGFPRNGSRESAYSPDLVRFMTGGNVSMGGPLVVIGHVVSGGSFRAAKGSTYLIGKDNTPGQLQELKNLYQASGSSLYWTPSDKGNHYVIPSYDVPRFIPASRIGANLPAFFRNARESIVNFKNCIQALNVNGRVIDNIHEWILRGNDPQQNVFLIDVRPNGLINKGIRAEVPTGSRVIVLLRTGPNAHLQYGVYGERWRANQTLYVFEDATNIYMEEPSDIWGSILAPQAMFHGHRTGGHVSGNAALGAFAVDANSGFEFHNFPFVGGVICGAAPEVPEVIPAPIEQPVPQCPECPTCPTPQPCPTPEPCPTPQPCPTPEPCPTCPEPRPCPTCPEPQPCPTCPTCPEPRPCPTCPTCPEPQPCPTCPECPTCPQPRPCPTCPECPPCPEPEQRIEYIAIPIPIKTPCPEPEPCPVCPVCPECLIKPGLIMGCIWGCRCCKPHEWDVKLYKKCNDQKVLINCVTICGYGCFEFHVPYEGCYILKICPAKHGRKGDMCDLMFSLKNIGVANFIME